MKVYWVRHGQTNYNVKDLCNDSSTDEDVYLTELGKKQSEIAAEKLKNKHFEIIFISELFRTKETAEIINRNHGAQIKVDSRINDRKTGFDGKPVSEFYKVIGKDKFNLKVNDGESFQEEKKRVFSFLESLKKLDYSSILIVSHCEIMQIISGYFKNLSDEEMDSIKIDNCQILEFDI